MKSVLLITLNSFMQSFSAYSKDTHRETSDMPLKSQIIGLILNAMGHDYYDVNTYNEPKVWSDKLRFAVRDDSTYRKRVISEFCRAQRYKYKTLFGIEYPIQDIDKEGKPDESLVTDIINKDYITNGRYTVLIEGEHEDIELISKALLHPKRQLYIGRKCCPFSSTSIWDKKENKPRIITDSLIEDVIFNERYIKYNRYNNTPLYLRKHIIEGKDQVDYKNRTLSDAIKSKLETSLNDIKWSRIFTIIPKANPVRFKTPVYGDMVSYSIIVLEQDTWENYKDMPEC